MNDQTIKNSTNPINSDPAPSGTGRPSADYTGNTSSKESPESSQAQLQENKEREAKKPAPRYAHRWDSPAFSEDPWNRKHYKAGINEPILNKSYGDSLHSFANKGYTAYRPDLKEARSFGYGGLFLDNPSVQLKNRDTNRPK